jgi:hypothetical protein
VLSHLLEAWTSLYANHPALRTGIEFVHVGGLVAGGGCAMGLITALASLVLWLLTTLAGTALPNIG